MTTLGQAVAEKLGEPLADVESVLAAHHVSMAAAPARAAKLHLSSLRFNAIKTLTGVHADGSEAGQGHVEEVPVEFSWTLGSGLHGVGSDKNLRGKSSVTRILLWAMRGRCDLREDVRRWLRHVEVGFLVDATAYRLSFDVTDGVASGELLRHHDSSWVTSGTFSDDAEFEAMMSATMMAALSLPSIAATQEGRRAHHSWPTYAGALVVRGDSLDMLLGDVRFAGLPSRLLQMFVGSDWAAARAEATSAHVVASGQLTQAQKAADERTSATRSVYETAARAVTEARTRLETLPTPGRAVNSAEAALRSIPALEVAISASARLVTSRKSVHDRVAAELASLRFARNAATEDALAHRFFQQLRPTACPRCSAPVTAERRAEEAQGHTCSVCITTLDLEAFEHDYLTATSSTADPVVRAAGPDEHAESGEHEEDEDEVVDDEAALERAVRVAQQQLSEVEDEQRRLVEERGRLTEVLADASSQGERIEERRRAELDLARAQGAADALRPAAEADPDALALATLRHDVAVLDAATKITTRWVTGPQRERLEDLSQRIAELARSFGMMNLTGVEIDGAARMKVITGGAPTSYSSCERGEKLRLKVATAVALIEQARRSGVGRHPGLLFVDSPGSEEMDEDDFDTMLSSLEDAATDADIQVIVATRHVDSLLELLGEERCRVGRGTNFVW